MLVQELYRIQNRLGWLPDGELRALAERCRVPLYRLEEVSSFFPHFRRQPPPELEIKVCRDMSCHLFGAGKVLEQLRKYAADRKLDATKVHLEGCSCLGRCDRAPVMMAEVTRHGGNGNGSGHSGHVFTAQNPASAVSVLEQFLAGKTPPDQPDASFPQHAKTQWEIDPYAGQPPEKLYEAVRWYLNASAESPNATQAAEADRAAEVLAPWKPPACWAWGAPAGEPTKNGKRCAKPG